MAKTPARRPPISTLRRTVGLVLLMIGTAWFFLGAGVLPGSFMTGQTVWAIVGAFVAIAGLAVLYLFPPKSAPADDAPTSEDPSSR